MTTENLLSQDEAIYELFFKIAESEQHFNTLQTKYRQIASLWLLGAFAAIGYILTRNGTSTVTLDGTSQNINPFLIALIICICTFIGLFMLFIMDILVYHRLLDAYFIEGLVLERKHDFLPPIRHMMRILPDGTNKGVFRGLVNFYVIPTCVFTIFGAMALAGWFFPNCYSGNPNSASENTLFGILVIFAVAFVLCRVIYLKMHRLSSSKSLFKARLGDLPPRALDS